jgi:hypothetical protein
MAVLLGGCAAVVPDGGRVPASTYQSTTERQLTETVARRLQPVTLVLSCEQALRWSAMIIGCITQSY